MELAIQRLGELDEHFQGKATQLTKDEALIQVKDSTEAVGESGLKRKRGSKANGPPNKRAKDVNIQKEEPNNFKQLFRKEQLVFGDARELANYQRVMKEKKNHAKLDCKRRKSESKRASSEIAAKAMTTPEKAIDTTCDDLSGEHYTTIDPGHLDKSHGQGSLAISKDACLNKVVRTATPVAGSNGEIQAKTTVEDLRPRTLLDGVRLRRDTQRLSLWQNPLSEYYSGRSDEFTQQQKEKIEELSKHQPRYLYHVHSRQGKRCTQGSADENMMAPAAVVKSKNVYRSIYDFRTLSELISNFGRRILWHIQHIDQFSSYTTSLLFAFVHALGRKTKGETDITISCLDTDKVRTNNGQAVEFYYVPELMHILEITDWKGWAYPRPYCSLLSPMSTHEYVVHGSIVMGDEPFRMVPFEDFEQAGIFDFLPGVQDDDVPDDMTRLYTRCVEMRKLWYHTRAPTPFTTTHLDHAMELAKLFVPHDPSTLDELSLVRSEHFQIFADFVALSRREGDEVIFEDYIKQYFTTTSVQDVFYPEVHMIPNNLPERIHALNRIRQACLPLAILPVPAQQVVCVDFDFDFSGRCFADLDVKFPDRKLRRRARERRERALLEATRHENTIERERSGVVDGSDAWERLTEHTDEESENEETPADRKELLEEGSMLALPASDGNDSGSGLRAISKQLLLPWY